MKKFVVGTSSFLGMIATLATVVMMIAIVLDVVVRGLTGASVPGVLELGETALVAAVFLGMAYTGAINGHIAVDLVTDRLPKQVSRWAISLAWVLTCGILVWMLYASIMRAIAATVEGQSRMGLVNWPLWPSRWFIVIGLLGMLLVAITNVSRTVRGKEVLGFQVFQTEVTNTATLSVAQEEREDLSVLTAINEPVLEGSNDEKDHSHG